MQPGACGAATSSASTQAFFQARGCNARCATGWRRRLGIDVIGGSVSRDDPSLRHRLLDRSGHGMPLHAELLHKRAGRWQRFAKPDPTFVDRRADCICSAQIRRFAVFLEVEHLQAHATFRYCLDVRGTPTSAKSTAQLRVVRRKQSTALRTGQRMSGLRFDMRIESHQH